MASIRRTNLIRRLASTAIFAGLLAVEPTLSGQQCDVEIVPIEDISGKRDVAVRLGWDPSPQEIVVGYKLYYGHKEFTYTNAIYASRNTTYLVDGLPPNTILHFNLTGYTASNSESPFTSELVFNTGFPTTTWCTNINGRDLIGISYTEHFETNRMVYGWSDSKDGPWREFNDATIDQVDYLGPISWQYQANFSNPLPSGKLYLKRIIFPPDSSYLSKPDSPRRIRFAN